MTARAATWHAALDGATRTPIADGLRMTLPAERIARITKLAVAEQQCCPSSTSVSTSTALTST